MMRRALAYMLPASERRWMVEASIVASFVNICLLAR